METSTTPHAAVLRLPRERTLELDSGRPLVMGVLNLTPDSFSDGGLYMESERAVERALEMERQGADLIDLGAESTRPGGGVYGAGACEVSASEELDRLAPVLERLRKLTRLPLSVDTRKAVVARAALAAGADLVNDVSALGDPEMAEVVASADVPVVLMHSRGELAAMQRDIAFDDVVREVEQELGQRFEMAVSAGIDRHQVVLDPGIGFGKTVEQNLTLLKEIRALVALGPPVLVGASRKSFLGEVSGNPPEERVVESLAV
ncbi:MAG: dihydropteroate synthase, partial [Thermoanaerobaculia bacterium]|nr:dihydropteroate synthase [Thermoanaerobaculia bacterium]